MRLHGDVSEEKLRGVFGEFVGEIYQRPPVRASVKRRLRTRRIYYLELLEVEGRNVLFRVGCEGGTYIRKLCVPGNTELVLINGGFRKIEELDDETSNTRLWNPLTISMDGLKIKKAKITKLYKLPAPNKLIRIKTESGIPITVTPDHEVLISTINGPLWVPACSLKVNDFIFSPAKIPVEEHTPYIVDLLDDEMYVVDQKVRQICIKGIKDKFGSIREMNRRMGINRKAFYSGSKMGIRIKYVKSFCDWDEVKKLISLIKTQRGRIIKLREKQVTYDLMYLLGLIASDGCIISGKKCIRPNRIKFHNSNKHLIKTFVRVYRKIFPNVPVHVKRLRSNLIEVDTYNPVLGEVAYFLGIKSPKKLMDLNGIFTLPEELIKGFLKGYFDGDGLCHVKKVGKRTYTIIEFCADFQLIAKRLYQLLKRLGIRCKIFQRKPVRTFRSSEGFVYSVRIINPADKWRFIEEIGSNHPNKAKHLQIIKEYLRKIRTVSYDYVPLHVNQMIEHLLIKNNIKRSHLKLGGNFYRLLEHKKPMTKYLLSRVIKNLFKLVKENEMKNLLSICNSDFYVEKIKSIEKIESNEEYVYDITVENTHNFIPEAVMVISNCYDIGEVLGCSAHMQELRRTRAGPLTEENNCVDLYDISYCCSLWKEKGDETQIRRIVMPMEKALEYMPKIYIRDSAVNAICHGASLAAPGVVSLETEIQRGDTVAIFTLKGEAVALATALVTTEEILKMTHGFVAKTKRVLMPRGIYPKMWRKESSV